MAEQRKQNFTSLEVKTKQKCGSRSAEAELYILGNNGRTEEELQIFGSEGKAEVRKRNFTSLEVPTEMKCGNGPTHI